jgi:hypothetical protein
MLEHYQRVDVLAFLAITLSLFIDLSVRWDVEMAETPM